MENSALKWLSERTASVRATYSEEQIDEMAGSGKHEDLCILWHGALIITIGNGSEFKTIEGEDIVSIGMESVMRVLRKFDGRSSWAKGARGYISIAIRNRLRNSLRKAIRKHKSGYSEVSIISQTEDGEEYNIFEPTVEAPNLETNTTQTHTVWKMLKLPNELTKHVLDLRYGISLGESMSINKVSNILGITSERVKNIERDACEGINKTFDPMGFSLELSKA